MKAHNENKSSGLKGHVVHVMGPAVLQREDSLPEVSPAWPAGEGVGLVSSREQHGRSGRARRTSTVHPLMLSACDSCDYITCLKHE